MIKKTAILRNDSIDTKLKSSDIKTFLNRFNNGFIDFVLKENPTVDPGTLETYYELREDGGRELREDGGNEIREN